MAPRGGGEPSGDVAAAINKGWAIFRPSRTRLVPLRLGLALAGPGW